MIRRATVLVAAQLGTVAGWSQTTAPVDRALTNPGPYLLQALLSLLLVVGLIYAAHFVARRVSGGGFAVRRSGPAQLVQTLPLGPGHTLHVVDLQGQRWLIVTGPGGTQIAASGSAPPAAGEDDGSA